MSNYTPHDPKTCQCACFQCADKRCFDCTSQPVVSEEPKQRSYFDMTDNEKKEIMDKATDESIKMQNKYVDEFNEKQKACEHKSGYIVKESGIYCNKCGEKLEQKACETHPRSYHGDNIPDDARCNHCEPEQKACVHGVKYLTSYTSDELLTTCKQCHQQKACSCHCHYSATGHLEIYNHSLEECDELNCMHCHPDHSLNTWDERVDDMCEKWQVDDVEQAYVDRWVEEIKELGNTQISLAVQKERERITKAIDRVEHIYRPQKEKWYIEQKGMLNIISDKGVEEK